MHTSAKGLKPASKYMVKYLWGNETVVDSAFAVNVSCNVFTVAMFAGMYVG